MEIFLKQFKRKGKTNQGCRAHSGLESLHWERGKNRQNNGK